MSAHDELLKIHRILLAPSDCPAITDDDTLTIRLLKDLIIWHRHQRQMAFGPVECRPQIAAMQQSQSDNIVAGTPTYGPDRPPRLRKQGETIEGYRAAMGWRSEAPASVERWLECSSCCTTIVIPDGLATVRWVNGDPICPTCGSTARYYDVQEVGAGDTATKTPNVELTGAKRQVE